MKLYAACLSKMHVEERELELEAVQRYDEQKQYNAVLWLAGFKRTSKAHAESYLNILRGLDFDVEAIRSDLAGCVDQLKRILEVYG